MKIADMKLTMAGQEQGLDILRAENDQLRAALQRFVTAAKSWHDFHHGSQTVQCDWICECMPAGEKALAGIPETDAVALSKFLRELADEPRDEPAHWTEMRAACTCPKSDTSNVNIMCPISLPHPWHKVKPPADRKSALDEIVRISEEAGLYDDPAAAVNICQGCRQPMSACVCASLLNRTAEGT